LEEGEAKNRLTTRSAKKRERAKGKNSGTHSGGKLARRQSKEEGVGKDKVVGQEKVVSQATGGDLLQIIEKKKEQRTNHQRKKK